MKRRYTTKQKREMMNFRTLGVLLCMAVVALGAFIGLLFFARPSESRLENRELAQFPSFTVTTFLDGTYFSDVSQWYADTYPARETFVRAENGLRNMCGIGSNNEIPRTTDTDADKSTGTDASMLPVTPADVTTEDPEIGLVK